MSQQESPRSFMRDSKKVDLGALPPHYGQIQPVSPSNPARLPSPVWNLMFRMHHKPGHPNSAKKSCPTSMNILLMQEKHPSNPSHGHGSSAHSKQAHVECFESSVCSGPEFRVVLQSVCHPFEQSTSRLMELYQPVKISSSPDFFHYWFFWAIKYTGVCSWPIAGVSFDVLESLVKFPSLTVL